MKNSRGKAPQKHPGDDPRWLDRPGNVDKIVYTLYGLCVVLLAIDLVYHKHGHFAFESWLGFYGLYGLIGSVCLVMLAKGLRRIVMRREDYYD